MSQKYNTTSNLAHSSTQDAVGEDSEGSDTTVAKKDHSPHIVRSTGHIHRATVLICVKKNSILSNYLHCTGRAKPGFGRWMYKRGSGSCAEGLDDRFARGSTLREREFQFLELHRGGGGGAGLARVADFWRLEKRGIQSLVLSLSKGNSVGDFISKREFQLVQLCTCRIYDWPNLITEIFKVNMNEDRTLVSRFSKFDLERVRTIISKQDPKRVRTFAPRFWR